ncbi:MAG: dihydropteroate synthase [Pseudomonadota bacterium]
MLRDIYMRPIGLYPTRAGQAAEEVWGGLQLSGGWLDFLGLEVIERNGATVERRIANLGDVLERDWGRRTSQASDLFTAIREPRRRIAGLSMERPLIMGIVNVTPDSFSDGGLAETTEAAIAHGERLVAEGADILDIGGESTRPGSDPVDVETERARIIPVIEALCERTDARISVDTRKAAIMDAAVTAGADIINDVSALSYDPESLATAAALDVPVILMHALGDPKTMQNDPTYDDVVLDVFDYLEARLDACQRAGIAAHKIVVDPGIGFGKTLDHNLALLRGLSLFHGLGVPVLLGASRKTFIGKLTGVELAGARVNGSLGAALTGIAQGVQIVRVHDVRATREAIDVWMAVH